jgi:opacity protein-like surface antigen
MQHQAARGKRMKLMIKFGGWAALIAALLLMAAMAQAQTVPDAWGAGESLWVGAEYVNLQAGFPAGSSVRLSGIGAYGNFNWNHHFGLEARATFLNFGQWHGETEQNYLAGPRYTFLRRNRLRPYASFDAGLVKIQYPFKMGTGTSFAIAPGGGVEYRLNRRFSVHGSYEYQMLFNSPNFTNEPHFGIRPQGFWGGLAYRIH